MRRSPFVIALVALVLSAICASLALLPAGTPAQAAAAKGGAVTYTFDKDKPGGPPPGWTAAETNGKGKPAKWAVVKEASAPSKPNAVEITQNQNRGDTFNLLINKAKAYKNLDIEVTVKALRGSEDQGGGPMWRVKDANNYYLARWNPLETNLRIYYVKNGRRIQLGSADVKTDAAKWHRISIVQRDNKMEASFDGKKLLTAEDGNTTEAGGIGLWTKADAASAFDDVKVSSAD